MRARPAPERREDLVHLYRSLCGEHVCPLSSTRTRLVFGSGNADADLMFVGEAPGAAEDRQGEPFVGPAGKLLDRLLAEIGMARTDAFIANVLKCRPPGNRDPLPEEIEECSPHLLRQIELIEPKVVCTLGNFATKLLSGSPAGITKVHGRPQSREVAGVRIQLYPIYHPAAALRTTAMLEGLRADFAALPALLDAARPPAPPAKSGLETGAAGDGDPAAPVPGPAEGSGEPAATQLDLLG